MDIILKYFPQLTEHQTAQFQKLAPLYNDWNSKINVISRKDLNSLYERHVLHSLSIAAAIPFNSKSKIIDIGTGGGFPGIPLAIFFPEVHFHLVDSIAKKLRVVEEVAKATGLENISIQHVRAGEPDSIKDNFDYAVSRAVAPLADLWQWSMPLLKKGKGIQSAMICLKGGNLTQEIKDSGLKPRIISISEMFSEDYFAEKVIVVASA